MRVRVLGPVEATAGERPVSLGTVKQRALLAMLAVHANQTLSADELLEGLWGEDAPRSAPKMVQQYVSRLRRAIGGDGGEILTRGRGYELRIAPTTSTPRPGRCRRQAASSRTSGSSGSAA